MFYAKAKFNQMEVKAETQAERDAIVTRVKDFFTEVGIQGEIETGVIKNTFDDEGNVVGSVIIADI